jgi:hypothetical protein
MYRSIMINGGTYCREHLLRYCPACETNYEVRPPPPPFHTHTHTPTHTQFHSLTIALRTGSYHIMQILRDEVDDERERLGIRLSGDPGLDQTGGPIGDQLITRFSIDAHGVPVNDGSSPFSFPASAAAQIPTMNELRVAAAEHKSRTQCTSCAYWACPCPTGVPLTTCSKCKIVKYCGKDCQAADWKWEHKFECTVPVVADAKASS